MVDMNKVCAVLLAAGTSSRMGFNKLTTLMGGRPMVSYALENLRTAGIKRIIAVIGHDRDNVKKAIGDGVEWVSQDDQLGTGDAAKQTIPYLSGEQHIVVLFGDCPFLDSEIIKETISKHYSTDAGFTIATARLPNPGALGKVHRDASGYIEKVTSFKVHKDDEIPEIFAGLSVWKASVFSDLVPRLKSRLVEQNKYEFCLPDAVELHRSEGGKVETYGNVSAYNAIAPNEAAEFTKAGQQLYDLKRTNLILQNVQIHDPQTVIVDYDVEVGRNSILMPNTRLLGKTKIGGNCKIGPDTTLINCIVGNDCVLGTGSWTDENFLEGSCATDRLRSKHRHYQKAYWLIPEEPTTCFVIMPFKEPYLSRYNKVIKPVFKKRRINCQTADNKLSGVIYNQIWEDINRSAYIVVDISENNANVWFELGLSFAMNKKICILCDEMIYKESYLKDKLPFDIQHERVLLFDSRKQDLSSQLTNWLDSNR